MPIGPIQSLSLFPYINNAGQIAFPNGVLYSGGTLTQISGTLTGISNSGQVIGTDSTGPFVYSPGSKTYLPFQGTPTGMNNSGQIVANLKSGKTILYSSGNSTDLGALLGTQGIVAVGINDAGQATGSFNSKGTSMGFFYSGGAASAIPLSPGAQLSLIVGINSLGQVLGNEIVNGRNDIFLYSGGVTTDIYSVQPR